MDTLTTDEWEIILYFRSLSVEGQHKMLEESRVLVKQAKSQVDSE